MSPPPSRPGMPPAPAQPGMPPPPPAYSGGSGPPGYPGMSTWPPPSQEPDTNRSAIASLVLGLLTPCALIPGMLSVVFGAVALRQIRRTGEKGLGLAVGGMAATGGWLVVIALGVAAAIAFDGLSERSPDRNDPGQIAAERDDPVESPAERDVREVSVDRLTTGDCLQEIPTGERVVTVSVLPCSEEHRGQVYTEFDLPGGDWPGEEAVFTQAEDGCLAELESFPDAYDDRFVGFFYLYPTRGSWRLGDREVVCITEYADGPRTGSLFD